MDSSQILFLDSVHPFLNKTLEENGMTCIHADEWPLEKIMEFLPLAYGIVIRSRVRLDKSLIDKCTRLRFIARAGAGMENIDQAAAESAGIICLNAPEGNRDAVGEHALGMLLALLNKLVVADREVRNGVWKRESNRGVEIKGKTVGIIGFGNTGSAFAKKLSGFEATIIAFDPYKKIDNGNFNFVKQVSLNTIFEESDIVSFHIPLTEETRYMVNESFLNSFRKSIHLVNTSRGKIVQTDSLVNAMKKGKVKGAALDVLEFESISFENIRGNEISKSLDFLYHSDNVVLSPHIAGWTFESHLKISEILAFKILNLLK